MDDYTPETDEIRHHYLCCWADEYRTEHEGRFDRWLAEVVRAAKHDGFVEGAREQRLNTLGFDVDFNDVKNPYEKE